MFQSSFSTVCPLFAYRKVVGIALFFALLSFLLLAEKAVIAQESARFVVVESMRAMAEFPWVPEKDIVYWKPERGVVFKANHSYQGIPYTQRQRNHNLEKFCEQITVKDGVNYYTGATLSDQYSGSDCSSAVSFAWKSVKEDFPICSTKDLFPKMTAGVLAVGEYEVVSTTSTKAILEANGEEKMFAAYSQLLPGDAVVKRNDNLGHVMLVESVCPEKNEIFIIDQTGLDSHGNFKGEKGTWRVHKKWTFESLYRDAYIPITIDALLESSSN